MAEPDWNPDTAGRPLAEILREAGIESPRSGRRRRWDDPEDTGIRQRRAAADADTGSQLKRRKSDREPTTGDRPRSAPPAVPEPSTAAIPGLRPSRTPGVPTGSTPVTGRRPAAAPATGPGRAASAPSSLVRDRTTSARSSSPAGGEPSTGPIPVVRADVAVDDLEDAGPRESALAWLRFAGELVIALAAGVGVYFLANVLWEMLPQAAVLLAPLAVTGLVAGVGLWRQRMGREPMGVRLLAVLVFAGALLTVAPAAGLLASG
ncbi:hypothetical protein OF117_13620 [Geodermatophilus sp. YIM 151500]|uniref:hypothetical protein n=1 Tax=Geodermatophilus sp. YIM 151500 TaxID=2984531 RepID=UPI0021E38161|nr:hypothetical protein [Geodermatophilus sp. YIM 151500]MCV2490402.1 hypothetical protein [Geodermatophilus sp. YIM 151500]